MEGHDSLLLGWYPTPTTPAAYPDLPPGPQAPSTSNIVRLPPGDYPDLRTPIIQQHEPGETGNANNASGQSSSVPTSVGNGVGTNVQLSGGPVTTSGGGTNEPTIVNVVGRLGTLTTNQGSHQQQQQQQQQIHLSSHHIVTPSVTQLHVAQAGTTATMIGGTPITTAQLGGQGGGTQVLQQVVAQTPGGGHQLVHMVLHHHGGNGQGNGAANAVSLGGTLQIGGLASVSGAGVTIQALTGSTAGMVNVGPLEETEEAEAAGPPFRCEECGHVAKTKRMLKRHLATVHSQERNYACPYCDAKYKSRSGLRVHSIKHNVGKHKCELCDKLFPYKGALEEHMKVVHEDFRFRCTWDGCEFSTTSKYLLKGHVSYNHEGGKYVDNKFRKKCRFCEYVGYDIRGHESAMHGLEPRFECPTCGKKFHFGSNLRQHKKVHLPLDQYPFVCDVCGDRFLRRRQLEDHFIGKHTNEKPHLCVKCGFSCASRRTMSDHAAANCYEKEAAMRCKFCAFETKIPFTMRTHKEECHPKHTVKRKKQRKAWQSDSDDDGGEVEEEDATEVTENPQAGAREQKMARRTKSSKVVYMPWSVKPDQADSDDEAEVEDAEQRGEEEEEEEGEASLVKQELLDEVTAQTAAQKRPVLAAANDDPTASAPARKRGRPPGSRSTNRKPKESATASSAVPPLKVTLKSGNSVKAAGGRLAKRKAQKKRVSRKRRKSSSDEDNNLSEELSDLDGEEAGHAGGGEDAAFLRELEANDNENESTRRRSSRRRKPNSWKISHDHDDDDDEAEQRISSRKHEANDGSANSQKSSTATVAKEALSGQRSTEQITTGSSSGDDVNCSSGGAAGVPTFLVPAPPKRRGRPPKRKVSPAADSLLEDAPHDEPVPEMASVLSQKSSPPPTTDVADPGCGTKEMMETGHRSEENASEPFTEFAGGLSNHSNDNSTENRDHSGKAERCNERIVNDDDDAVVQISFDCDDGNDDEEGQDSHELTMMNCYVCNTFFIDGEKFRKHMKDEHQFEMIITAD